MAYIIAGEEPTATGVERAIGPTLTVDQIHVPWGAPVPIPFVFWDLPHGRIRVISLSAARTDRRTAGAHESKIRAVAVRLRDLQAPVILRWVRCASAPDFRAETMQRSRSGTSYVDWVAADGCNRARLILIGDSACSKVHLGRREPFGHRFNRKVAWSPPALAGSRAFASDP
jgi:hypothetical protein